MSSSSQDAQKKDVKAVSIIVASQASSLSISDGSAKGTILNVPSNALEEGASISLDRVDPPQEFQIVSGKIASPAVAVDAVTPQGEKAALLSPMTLTLPFSGAEDLSLEEIQPITSNLCVLLKTPQEELYVWRYEELNIHKSEKTLSLETHALGIYQASFCGKSPLSGVKDFQDEPSLRGNSYWSFSYSLEDLSPWGEMDHYCFAMSEDWEAQKILASMEHSGGGTLNLEIDQKYFQSPKETYWHIWGQTQDQTCWEGAFSQSMSWALKTEDWSSSPHLLGQGSFTFNQQSVFLEGTSSLSGCLSLKSEEAQGFRSWVSGSNSVKVLGPHSSLSMEVGSICQFEKKNKDSVYEIFGEKNKDLYLQTSELTLKDSTKLAAGDENMAVEFFSVGSLKENMRLDERIPLRIGSMDVDPKITNYSLLIPKASRFDLVITAHKKISELSDDAESQFFYSRSWGSLESL